MEAERAVPGLGLLGLDGAEVVGRVLVGVGHLVDQDDIVARDVAALAAGEDDDVLAGRRIEGGEVAEIVGVRVGGPVARGHEADQDLHAQVVVAVALLGGARGVGVGLVLLGEVVRGAQHPDRGIDRVLIEVAGDGLGDLADAVGVVDVAHRIFAGVGGEPVVAAGAEGEQSGEGGRTSGERVHPARLTRARAVAGVQVRPGIGPPASSGSPK